MKDTFIAAVLLVTFLAPNGYGRTVRVDSELAAFSAALESYKADHGHYPTDVGTTQKLKPNSTFDPALYIPASRFLYRELSADGDPSTTSPNEKKRYFEFRPAMLRFLGSRRNTYIVDPWGNSYGYSTLKSVQPNAPDGNNPSFDLWSTGGGTTQKDRKKWTVNW